jgi:hypothetical protein
VNSTGSIYSPVEVPVNTGIKNRFHKCKGFLCKEFVD